MKIKFAGIVMALVVWAGLAAPVQSQDYGALPIEDLIDYAPDHHPAALYILASRLLARGEGQEAANWMYAGQLRYRFLIMADDSGPNSDEGILFNALTEQVGRPVNEYIAGDVDEWMAAIDWALEWDAANPNPLTSKSDNAEALATLRDGLADFRDSLDERRDEIARTRVENGLINR